MTDFGERIASLEADSKHQQDTHDDVVDQLKTLNRQVIDINSKLDKNAGFLAGAAFVFTMLGAFIGMGGAAIFKKLIE